MLSCVKLMPKRVNSQCLWNGIYGVPEAQHTKRSSDLSCPPAASPAPLAAAGGGAYPAPPRSIRARMAKSRSSCSFFSFSLACSSLATLFLVSTASQYASQSSSWQQCRLKQDAAHLMSIAQLKLLFVQTTLNLTEFSCEEAGAWQSVRLFTNVWCCICCQSSP